MPLKIYKRIGLRRDQNLADTSNRVTSLNNLLDGLSNISGGSFISEDLNAIRDLYTSGITSTEYQQIIDTTVEETDEDGNDFIVSPLINFKNRLDIFSIFTNSTTRGGDGLTAKYYTNDDVDETSDDIFSGLIWTGHKSIELGLADEIGSIDFVAREVIKETNFVDYTLKVLLKYHKVTFKILCCCSSSKYLLTCIYSTCF